VDLAVLFGIALSLGVHLWRERSVRVGFEMRRGGIGVVVPEGVLWFASAPELVETVGDLLATDRSTRELRVDLGGLGRIDFTSAVLLRDLVEDAREAGVEVEVINVPDHAERILDAVWPERESGGGSHTPHL
jgi:SulP family sulfate permease